MATLLAQLCRSTVQHPCSGHARALTITGACVGLSRSSLNPCTLRSTTHSIHTLTLISTFSHLHRFTLPRPPSLVHQLRASINTSRALSVKKPTSSPPVQHTPLSSPSPSTTTTTATAPATLDTSTLPLVYKHDRSRFYRNLTIASALSLGLLWLPLTYFSLLVASPPLYATLLGPLATTATLIATHYRTRRVVHTLHRTPQGLLVHTYTMTGRPHRIGQLPYHAITPLTSSAGSGSGSGGGSGGKGYWVVRLAGYERFFLIDRQGDVVDREVMKRVVGFDAVETDEEKVKRQRDGVRGPGTLGRLNKR